MEKRSFGAPTSKSEKVAQLRQQFWSKQPQNRKLAAYKTVEQVTQEDLGVHETKEKNLDTSAAMGEFALKEANLPEGAELPLNGSGVDDFNDPIGTSEINDTLQETLVEHLVERNAVSLEEKGDGYGDLYKTAVDLFPGITSLKNFSGDWLELDDTTSHSETSQVLSSDAQEAILNKIRIGTRPVNPVVRSRLIDRMGLQQKFKSGHDDVFHRIVFAHELGHAMQNDVNNFVPVFGEMNMEVIDTHMPDNSMSFENKYKLYVNSDREANADYIAAMIIGNSKLGKDLGISAPEYGPQDWRKWVREL